MRRVSFALVLTLVLSFGLAFGQTGFRVEFTPLVSDVVATNFAASGGGITVNVYHTNSQMRTGWSTPFAFYGTGTVQITGPGTHAADPAFAAIWTMGTFTSEESWDGDLTTGNTSYGPGELWNFSGLTLSGYMPGPEMLAFIFTFTFDADDDDDCQTIEGQFCIDSGDFDDNTYDWLFDPAEPFGGPYCVDVKKPCNLPAEFDVGCPTTSQSLQWDQQFGMTFTGHDQDDPPNLPLHFFVVSGVGVIDEFTGQYIYNPDCSDVGSQSAVIRIEDDLGDGEECTINFDVLNTAPVIGGDCEQFFTIGTLSSNPDLMCFTVTDANVGDVFTWDAWVVEPPYDTCKLIEPGTFGPDFCCFDVTCLCDYDQCYDVVVRVTDCNGDYDECMVHICQQGQLPFDIVIEKEHGPTGLGVLQGHHVYVDVSKMRGTPEMHGFDFLIGYDASALTFIGAEQGQILTDLEWEYFTYRYNWNGNCGNACPSGLLRVVALGETNDGPHHPLGYDIPDGSVLFTMDFLVTNDRNFGCMFVPIAFYWHDCGDNSIAMYEPINPPGDIRQAVSKYVYHYGGTEIFYGEPYYEVTDLFFGFPTWYGTQFECLDSTYYPDKPPPYDKIWFFGGGVDIICPEDIDDRGDINLNGVANEIADAVVFTNYFIYGLSAFVINVEGQIAATEVNGDGMVLTVADLVYLIRVIVGDALPLPKPTPAGELQVVNGDMVTFNQDVGAAAFVFEGNANLSLADGAAGMELISNFRDGMTYALIYTMNPGITASGDVLIVNGGNLVSVEAADYIGNPFEARILPSKFELAQNAPNPFNMATSVKMALPVASDWTLSIYNVAGQRVLDYNGFSEGGIVEVNVDMTGLGTGVYFYKAVAGEFSATKKMVLLK